MELITQFIINSLIAGSLYAIVALSFNLMYATGRFYNLAIGGLIPVGGYGAFFVSERLGMPLVFGVIAGTACAGFAGLALDRFVYAPLRKKKASGLVLLIASLGAFTALQALIAMLFSSDYQPFSRLSRDAIDVFGGTITPVQAAIILSAPLLTLCIAAWLRWTFFGKVVRAVSDDLEVSKIVGIDTEKIFATVFFFASALAGYAGVLLGLDIGLDPLMGFLPMIAGIVGAIVGGMGETVLGYAGSLVGAFLQNGIIFRFSQEWSSPVTFALLILFLLFRPHGLFKK